jgi:hypothetical protein
MSVLISLYRKVLVLFLRQDAINVFFFLISSLCNSYAVICAIGIGVSVSYCIIKQRRIYEYKNTYTILITRLMSVFCFCYTCGAVVHGQNVIVPNYYKYSIKLGYIYTFIIRTFQCGFFFIILGG